MFELYNLASATATDELDVKSRQLIKLLNTDLAKQFPDAFTLNSDTGEGGSSPKKRPRQNPNTGNGLGDSGHVYHDRLVVDEFTRAGYTLESNDEYDPDWVPINKVK
jgi:hypothetical protein